MMALDYPRSLAYHCDVIIYHTHHPLSIISFATIKTLALPTIEIQRRSWMQESQNFMQDPAASLMESPTLKSIARECGDNASRLRRWFRFLVDWLVNWNRKRSFMHFFITTLLLASAAPIGTPLHVSQRHFNALPFRNFHCRNVGVVCHVGCAVHACDGFCWRHRAGSRLLDSSRNIASGACDDGGGGRKYRNDDSIVEFYQTNGLEKQTDGCQSGYAETIRHTQHDGRSCTWSGEWDEKNAWWPNGCFYWYRFATSTKQRSTRSWASP